MFPVIRIGPLNLQAPGLILLISIWAGLELSERTARKRNFPVDKLYNLVFIALIAGVLGSRLSYAISHFDAFIGAYSSLISLNLGLFDPLGGLAISILVGAIYVQRKDLGIWKTFDAITPLLASLAVGINMATLASGYSYGSSTELPWGIDLWGAKRHPSQIYGLIAASLTLAFVWKDSAKTSIAGLIFLRFVLITCSWVIFLEGFRGDNQPLLMGIRDTQIGAFILFFVTAFVYEKRISGVQKESEIDKVEYGQNHY